MYRIMAGLLLLIISLLFLMYFLVATPLGLRIAANIGNNAGIGLSIQGVNGTLSQGVSIKSLVWQGPKARIELKQVGLKLKRNNYFKKVLKVDSLTAAELNIYVKQRGTPRTQPITIPDIPIPVNLLIDRVQLDKLNIIKGQGRKLFTIEKMKLTQLSNKNNQLLASMVKATPIIAGSDMDIVLYKATLDLNQPHAMSGRGSLLYSHPQTGGFAGSVAVGGTLTNYEVTGDIRWHERLLGDSRILIQGFGDYDKATVTELTLEHPEGRFVAQSDIQWKKQLTWQTHVKGSNIHSQRFTPQWPAIFDFNMDSTGSYQYERKKWQMDARVTTLDGEVAGLPVHASGLITWKEDILRAEDVQLNTDKNQVFLAGRITEPFNINWDVNVKNMAELLPNFKGSIVGKGVATGTTIDPSGYGKLKIRGMSGEGVRIDFADVDIQGGSQDRLLAGKGNIKIKNVTYRDIKIGSAEMDFDGREKPSFLSGKGVIKLTKLNAKAFDFVSAKINFDGSKEHIELQGDVDKVNLFGQKMDSAHLSANGTLDNHNIQLTGNGKEGSLLLKATGGWLGETWKGKIKNINVTKTKTGNWSLQKPVNINATKNTFTGSEICIINPRRGQLCSDTAWDANAGVSSEGKLFGVSLAQFERWLPENISLPGNLNATYALAQRQKGIFGKALFQLPDSFVKFVTKSGKDEKLAYHDGKVRLTFNGNKVGVSVNVQIENRGVFSSQSTVTLVPDTGKHLVKGEAMLKVDNLAWAQEYFADITQLRGEITSKVSFNGLLSKPKYSGRIELKEGHLNIPDTGTELSNIDLTIQTTRPNQATVTGSLNTGKGHLNVAGMMKINQLNDWVAELSMKGNNLLFMNTHEIQAYATPDLRLKITPDQARIEGNFHIPKATVKLSELPETALYESSDVIFVSSEKSTEENKKPLSVIPNVAISLGEDIDFDGFGLKAKLKGRFFIGHSHNALVSRGTIKVQDGVYRAYGQRLSIEHGVLIFQGPVNNPGIDIRATRSVDDIKVGINLGGTLQEPSSSVFSDPLQTESDALSYLVTGQSLSETSGDQTRVLLQAVRTLGINSGVTMLSRIGNKVGLDDVNIISFGDYKKNKLQLGKRLGTNLYIRYITGLFDTFHEIAVDYKLSKKWALQAESGEIQRLDFIYNIDTD